MVEATGRRFAARVCMGLGYVGYGISVAACVGLLVAAVQAVWAGGLVGGLPPVSAVAVSFRLPETGGEALRQSPSLARQPVRGVRAPRLKAPVSLLSGTVPPVAVTPARSVSPVLASASSVRFSQSKPETFVIENVTSDVLEASDVLPAAEIFGPVALAVPYRSQGDLGGRRACSPTSLHMILDYFHSRDAANRTLADTEELLRLMRATGRFADGLGSTAEQTAAEARELGYAGSRMYMHWTRADLAASLADGRPVIAVVGLGFVAGGRPHSVVVTGLSRGGDSVLVNDPWFPDIREVSWPAFEAAWSTFRGCERHGVLVAP